MEYSLFDEASRDYDEEARDHRVAFVRTALVQEIFPFLALAQTPEDYANRKALALDRLSAIASRYDSSLAETEEVADRMYRHLVTARQASKLTYTASAMQCGECKHTSTDHSEGLPCHCGCSNFTPETKSEKEARRVTADEGDGPFS